MNTAIIGLSCRFPDATNATEFWKNMIQVKSSVTAIPPARWDWKEYWGGVPEPDEEQSKWGTFVDQVYEFDQHFFGLTPAIVQAMDPQQRFILELAWSCLEDAGIASSSLENEKVGVYIGVCNHDYKELRERSDLTVDAEHFSGTAVAGIPNRVSDYFNFTGPSVPIDTAGSGSLNAIHNAIQAMAYGDCVMALAGGINLLLSPTRHIAFSKMGMLSLTGSCKTFDQGADGYVRGEGAGLILLKPLDKALADGDSIYGVIKGSAVNHCGGTQTLTFPSVEAQAEVIVSAHKRAKIPIESVGYVEAHGSGASVEDALEFNGLHRAFKTLVGEKKSAACNYCGLGSVKTNIGHLEAAAGIAGVIKVLLSLKHKQLPPLSNFKKLNSLIALEETPFYIVDRHQAWKSCVDSNGSTLPLRAGVSAFGFSGTNAHVVLEEAPVVEKVRGVQLPGHLICLSAKTKGALERRKRALEAYLEENPREADLLSISATLLLGRDHFEYREAYVVKSVTELLESLNNAAPRTLENTARGGGQEIICQLSSKQDVFADPDTYKQHLTLLAASYMQGEALDWRPLFSVFEEGRVRRVHLPTYPFSRIQAYGETERKEINTFSTLHSRPPPGNSESGEHAYGSETAVSVTQKTKGYSI